MFTVSANLPVTVLPAAGKSVLGPGDFTARGIAKMNAACGQFTYGFAKRSNGNFFCIGQAGAPPYNLYEQALPSSYGSSVANAPVCSLVKSWGGLNQGGILNTTDPAQRMEGLWWEEATQLLWFSYGSYYDASATNNPCIGYVDLSGASAVVHGPWKVPAIGSGQYAPGSEGCKGKIFPAPPALAAITGLPFVMSAPLGSTAQSQSWGLGLVAVDRPAANLPAGSILTAKRLSYWPQTATGPWAIRGSNWPRIPLDYGSGVYLSNTNFSVQTPFPNNFMVSDGLFQPTWIEGPNKWGVFLSGYAGYGYGWYGHEDGPRTNGVNSLWYPGQLTKDPEQISQGNHAEFRKRRWYMVDPQRVLDVAAKVQAGTATATDMQLPWDSAGDWDTLGGSPVYVTPKVPNFSDAHWDAASRRLYEMCPGAANNLGAINVWDVAA